MSTVIVVDSACELPESYLNSKTVKVLPINIELGEEKLRDDRDSAARLALLDSGLISGKVYGNSDAATVEQSRAFLSKEILPFYDYAIVQTVSNVRSNQFDLWFDVNKRMAGKYAALRGPNRKNFAMSIIDSGTAFTGQGLVVLETLHQARIKKSRRELLEHLKEYTKLMQSYSAPADLAYLRSRAVQRGDKTIGFIDTFIGKALKISPILFGVRNELGMSAKAKGHTQAINRLLEHAIKAVEDGLRTPYINLSYGGPLEALNEFPLLETLKELAASRNYKVLSSVSCLSSLINLGPRNFSLSLAPNDPSLVISE